ncbi:MAG: SPOR domain-containing protein [Magnetococcus sp. YQC-5]
MKISPNREQWILVMIMNGMVGFIVVVLSLGMLLAPANKNVQNDHASQTRERDLLRPKSDEALNHTQEGSPTQADLNPAHAAHRADPSTTKPPLPTQSPEAMSAMVQLPPPMPVGKVERVDKIDKINTNEKEEATKPMLTDNGFSVQLGAFASDDKASALVAKLSSLKFEGKPLPVMKQTIKVGNKVMYRVRLGPFSSQARAKMAAGLASREASVDGTVLRAGQ